MERSMGRVVSLLCVGATIVFGAVSWTISQNRVVTFSSPGRYVISLPGTITTPAIANAEQLLYLLLCITIALPLGVNHPLLGVGAVLTSTVVVVATRLTERGNLRGFLVTASGTLRTSSPESVTDTLSSLSAFVIVDSLEVDQGYFTVSARTRLDGSKETLAALWNMRRQVDDLQVSLQALDGPG